MGTLYSLLFGPQLYRMYPLVERQPNIVENIGNNCMSVVRAIFYVSTSLAFGPIIFTYLYQRVWITSGSSLFIGKYFGILLICAFGGRAVGRAMDPTYRHFLSVWNKAASSGKSEDNEALKRFDFEIKGVNADYVALPNEKLWFHKTELLQGNPLVRAVGWYAVHAFGRHMMYPGSMAILNYMLSGSLQTARSLMVTNKQGKRAWIRSSEGDLIDAMYIRGEQHTNGPEDRSQYLVITCEGNAGFYEIGIANTPGQLGYSVLGWNHPGFGESSGLPFPKNTLAAADAVMQYALNVLKYPVDKIVIFGWSIGGFPSSWLAANYPDLRAVILDATFDDVLPLAESRMPGFLGGVVKHAIRKYLNLEIHQILARYKGPLRLIRRLQEEILTTDTIGTEHERRATNRANFLLKEVLRIRHASLVKGLEPQVDSWLAMTPNERVTLSALQSETEEGLRRARLFNVCDYYLVDFDASHVSPLDPGYFHIPKALPRTLRD